MRRTVSAPRSGDQRAILSRRQTIVDRLYAFDDPEVILIET